MNGATAINEYPPEPDWDSVECRSVVAPADDSDEGDTDVYRLRGVVIMIASGLIAYAVYSSVGSLAGTVSSFLAQQGFSAQQASAIASCLVLATVSAVGAALIGLWAFKSLMSGFRMFLIDNETWLDRFANGGNRG